jgi:UDP-2-acetamido-3-amino-2,3-dideoxy-glucuronate N-acetyltransferase
VASGAVVGNGVKIQNNVSVFSGVVCEDDTFLGPGTVFTNVINPRSFIERKEEYKITIIKKGASIGANATIICGNNVGEFALVGAGSVVTKSIPDFAMVVGNPASVIAWVDVEGQKLNFDKNGMAISNNRKYYLKNNEVKFVEVNSER